MDSVSARVATGDSMRHLPAARASTTRCPAAVP